MSKRRHIPPLPKQCRKCGKLIFWAQSKNGVAMPIDAKVSPIGNVLLAQDATGKLKASVIPNCTPDAPCKRCREGQGPCVTEGRNRYVAHHATCKPETWWKAGA